MIIVVCHFSKGKCLRGDGQEATLHRRDLEESSSICADKSACTRTDNWRTRSSNYSFRNEGAREIKVSLKITSGSYYQCILLKIKATIIKEDFKNLSHLSGFLPP